MSHFITCTECTEIDGDIVLCDAAKDTK